MKLCRLVVMSTWMISAVVDIPCASQVSDPRSSHELIQSDPFPLDGILKWLADHGKSRFVGTLEVGFIARIKKVGIAFEPKDENMAKIEAAGGSRGLCSAIKDAKVYVTKTQLPEQQ